MAPDSRLLTPFVTISSSSSSSPPSPSSPSSPCPPQPPPPSSSSSLPRPSPPPPSHPPSPRTSRLIGREGLVILAPSPLSCPSPTTYTSAIKSQLQLQQSITTTASSSSPLQSSPPPPLSSPSSPCPKTPSPAKASSKPPSSSSPCSPLSSSSSSTSSSLPSSSSKTSTSTTSFPPSLSHSSSSSSTTTSSSSSSSSSTTTSSSSSTSPPVSSSESSTSTSTFSSTTSPTSCSSTSGELSVERQSPTRDYHPAHRWSLWPLVLLIVCLPKEATCGEHERRLLHDLLDNYNQLERPVGNESEPVVVSFGITLQQIIDVDEKNQLLITNTWLKLEWNDVNLRWNESDYGGIKDLRIPPYKIWKPDVLMYNSADEGFDGTYQTKVVVSSDGTCLYIPPGIFKSTCKIDITWFPFDDQRCKMKFGSWTYSGWQLDLQLQSEDGGDLSDFIKNGEWDLIGCPGKRNAIYYKCCPEPYVDVTFEIVIRRRTLYYFCNLILPCVLIASMAVLGFTLPPDCGEKLSLGVTVLLSLCVFSQLINDTLPQTSDAVPLLGTYFNCIMFMVASSVVSTVLILNFHHRSADTHEMSPMVKSVFLQWLPWVLRINRPGEKITRKSIMLNNKMRELEMKERSSKSLLANVLDIDDDFRAHTLPHTHTTNNTAFIRVPHGGHSVDDSHLVHTCMSSCTRELNLILKEIRMITDKMRKKDEDDEVVNDWKFAAMVVDRLCLLVFTLFTVIATVAVLLSAPHI
ncbi:neuronal acetylcholine receptor subunit alpha-7 isoform X3 [Penaeus vannamei]|uniref:neuronal acetylcholine receptor subunit alpha-7 isoform X3 n=1 Tax=Penaeus vannamei TaxID=6689 RepID=UPI00387F847A